MLRSIVTAVTLGGWLAMFAAPAGAADCKLRTLGEFHVDLTSGVPVVDGEIDGKPAKVLIDSGATTSLILRSEANRLGLDLHHVAGTEVHVVGGATEVLATRVKSLKFGNFSASNLPLLVTGPSRSPAGVAVVLGDDFLSQYDVEFDLADGVIRIFQSQGCAPGQLVYWGKSYSMASMLPWPRDYPSIQTDVLLNGRRERAEIDSGAASSVVNLTEAEAAGAVRDAEPTGGAVRGLGPSTRRSWTGRFDSFAFGDEKIGNARMDLTDLASDFEISPDSAETKVPTRLSDTPDVLIGADFLHAHRVMVGAKEHVIVFSYSGGPVFLTRAPAGN